MSSAAFLPNFPPFAGNIVRAENYLSGGAGPCGDVPEDFWRLQGMQACGFGVSGRRMDQLMNHCSSPCSPQVCNCSGKGCGLSERERLDVDSIFQDIGLQVSAPLDYIYGENMPSAPPLRNTKLSYAYGLRPSYATATPSSPCDVQNVMVGTQGEEALVPATMRFMLGP